MRKRKEIEMRIQDLNRLAWAENEAGRIYSAEAVIQQVNALNWVLGKEA
jgi:hypothetical protein